MKSRPCILNSRWQVMIRKRGTGLWLLIWWFNIYRTFIISGIVYLRRIIFSIRCWYLIYEWCTIYEYELFSYINMKKDVVLKIFFNWRNDNFINWIFILENCIIQKVITFDIIDLICRNIQVVLDLFQFK